MSEVIASAVPATNATSAGDVVNYISGTMLDYAILLAAIGTITMAIIELYKSVRNSRLHFHKKRTWLWLHADNDSTAYSEMLSLATGHPIKDTFVTPQTVGFARSAIGEVHFSDVIFDQPTDKMMGQMQAAVNIVLDFPNRYPALYAFLTGSESARILHEDAQLWLTYCNKVSTGVVANGIGAEENKQLGRDAAQARARLANLVARKLDGFQNETQYLWAEYNQRASVVIGTVFLLYVLTHFEATYSGKPLGIGAILLLSVFGGMISPFAKDIVSALSGLNAKRK